MYAIVYVTAGDRKKAETLGRKMVEERLAACANIFPIRSIYRWKGNVEEGDEAGIIFKTKEKLIAAFTKRIEELHDYELPCIVSWKIDCGSKQYLDWIGKSTKKDR